MLTDFIYMGAHEEHRLTSKVLGQKYITITICHNCNKTPVTTL